MKKKPISIISFLKNKEGGILVPVLAIFMMFTLLLLFVTEDYYLRRETYVNTKDFYLAKTMEELSSIEIGLADGPTGMEIPFNIGTSKWTFKEAENNYSVVTSLSNQYKRTSNYELNLKR